MATALRNYELSILVPGIKINTDPENIQPIKQLRLIRFDERTWQPIGDVIERVFGYAENLAIEKGPDR
ncbi:hypothetical protein ACFIOY_15335 [Bradyrhizobium sp. TZ2]